MKRLIERIINKLKRIYQEGVAIRQLKKIASGRIKKQSKKVVFMVHYVPSWIRQKLVYEALCASDKAEAFIVCVPSNIEETDPKKNDIYNYFIENGYDAINAINEDGSLFDIKTLEPDFVFQSRPYNEKMPKEYQSSEIASFTKLCNISYATCLGSNGIYTVMHPDYFRDLSIYFTELPSAKRTFEKIYRRGVKAGVQKAELAGAANLEWIHSMSKNAKDYYPALKAKYRYMWTPRWSYDPILGGSNFFEYKDFLLDYMDNNNDASLLIRPHPLMFSHFIEKGYMTPQEEAEFRTKCAETKNIALDEMKEYYDNFCTSDILITDVSAIILDYFITGKPIIYCKPDIYIDFIEEMVDIITGCYIANNQEEINQYMKMLESGEDPLKEKRFQLIEKYFSLSFNGAGKRIAEILINEP